MQFTLLFLKALGIALGYLAPVLATLVALICLNGLLIGRVEGWPRGAALYHAFINATTVGYGDLYPETRAGRVLSVLNAFLGLLLTGIFVGAGVQAVGIALRLTQ